MGIPGAGIPRFPGAGSSARGQPVPKARPKGVADGRRVNIPVLAVRVITDGDGSGLATRPDGWRVQARRPGMQANPHPQGRNASMSAGDSAKLAMPDCQEKLLGIARSTVPKPTQVEGY